MDITEKLQKVFRDVFDDEHIIISEQTKQSDIKNWDSLAHIRLILSCENEFGIKFSTSEVMNLITVNDFLSCIKQKTA